MAKYSNLTDRQKDTLVSLASHAANTNEGERDNAMSTFLKKLDSYGISFRDLLLGAFDPTNGLNTNEQELMNTLEELATANAEWETTAEGLREQLQAAQDTIAELREGENAEKADLVTANTDLKRENAALKNELQALSSLEDELLAANAEVTRLTDQWEQRVDKEEKLARKLAWASIFIAPITQHPLLRRKIFKDKKHHYIDPDNKYDTPWFDYFSKVAVFTGGWVLATVVFFAGRNIIKDNANNAEEKRVERELFSALNTDLTERLRSGEITQSFGAVTVNDYLRINDFQLNIRYQITPYTTDNDIQCLKAVAKDVSSGDAASDFSTAILVNGSADKYRSWVGDDVFPHTLCLGVNSEIQSFSPAP